MPVRIVTDSSAGLPADVVEELGITVVDLHVMSDGDGASTAGLSSLELVAAYARQLERGGDEGVLALHLAKELSSTWSAAVQAAAIFPDEQVRVIETGSVGMAVGAAAMTAAKLASEGADLKTCHDIAVDTLERSATWVYLHGIDDIRKSGRISTGTALSATLLATKPIMSITDGKLELVGKTRTQEKAFTRLVELVIERAEGRPVFVAIQHHEAEDSAAHLEGMLDEVLPEGSSLMTLPMEATLAVHTGPGAVGVSAVFMAQPEHLVHR
mgnify:FL=1